MQTILSTQHNFRDLGGIRVSDGRQIKPGLLFRSGDLYSLSDEDILKLEQMNLATIIDLRAGREIAQRPDKVVSTVIDLIHIDIHDAARDKAEKFLENNDAKGLETVLIGDYIRMVNIHQADFSKFLNILSTTENLPLVYHCAAGKDRTGMATVLLLVALGAGMEAIWKDYMATNDFCVISTEKIISKVKKSGLNGDLLRPLLEVREEYLNAALAEIDTQFGGLENYVVNVLNADVAGLREKYLEIYG